MAEKTGTKELESEKEQYEAPIAEAAEEVIEENPEASEEEVQEEIEEELEENKEIPEDVEKTQEEVQEGREPTEEEKRIASWNPKTKLGREVKEGKVKNIDEILDNNKRILEPEIVDSLINVKSELVSIGQSKGKFGGGKRRAWRQTQKKTKEGNIPTFSALAIAGDENGHVGVGGGRAKETLPARDKAIRQAKLGIIKVNRGCGGFDCACAEQHSIPRQVTGKEGSVKVTLIPAPQGTGLVVANELKKVLQLAGIKDVYSKTFGQKRTTFNLIKSCINALEKTNLEK